MEDRYKITEEIKHRSGKRRLSTIYYPEIPERDADYYLMSKRGMRWDNLAAQAWGDPRYWYILAKANGIVNGSLVVPPGQRIRIPSISLVELEDLINEKQF